VIKLSERKIRVALSHHARDRLENRYPVLRNHVYESLIDELNQKHSNGTLSSHSHQSRKEKILASYSLGGYFPLRGHDQIKYAYCAISYIPSWMFKEHASSIKVDVDVDWLLVKNGVLLPRQKYDATHIVEKSIQPSVNVRKPRDPLAKKITNIQRIREEFPNLTNSQLLRTRNDILCRIPEKERGNYKSIDEMIEYAIKLRQESPGTTKRELFKKVIADSKKKC